MRNVISILGSIVLVACAASEKAPAPAADEITVTPTSNGFVAIARDGHAIEASLRVVDGQATIVTADKRTAKIALLEPTPESAKEALRGYLPRASSGIHTADLSYEEWCDGNLECMMNPRPSAEAWAEWSEEQDGYHWSDAEIDYLAGGIGQNCMNFFIASKCAL